MSRIAPEAGTSSSVRIGYAQALQERNFERFHGARIACAQVIVAGRVQRAVQD